MCGEELECSNTLGLYLVSLGSLPKGTRTLSVAVNGVAVQIFAIDIMINSLIFLKYGRCASLDTTFTLAP